MTDFAGYIDQIPDEFKTLGTVSGHVGVNVEDAEIAHLEADIALQNGVLATSGMLTDPAYGSANVIGTYARGRQALNIAKLEIMMADGRELSFVGGVNDIGTSSVSFAGGLKAGNFALRTILADWPELVAVNYRGFIEAHVDGGYLQDGTAQIAGRYNPVNGALSLSQFDFDGDFSGLRVNAATDQYRRAVGTVDGNFSVRMGAMGKIDALDLAATVTDGSILLSGRDAPVLVSAANIQAQFTNDRTLVSGLTADFGPSGKMSLSANIGVDDENAIETSAIEINADDFDAALFTALWPARTAPVTRRWLHQNMPSGRMRDAKLSFHTRCLLYTSPSPRDRG